MRCLKLGDRHGFVVCTTQQRISFVSFDMPLWCPFQYLISIFRLFRKMINEIITRTNANKYPLENWIFLYYTFSLSSRPFLDMLEASLSSLVSSCVLFCSWSFSLNNKTCRAFSTCCIININSQLTLKKIPYQGNQTAVFGLFTIQLSLFYWKWSKNSAWSFLSAPTISSLVSFSSSHWWSRMRESPRGRQPCRFSSPRTYVDDVSRTRRWRLWTPVTQRKECVKTNWILFINFFI